MKCPYCKKLNPNHPSDNIGALQLFVCRKCFENWDVEYQLKNPNTTNWISIYNYDYLVELIINEKRTRIFAMDNGNNPKKPIELNYLLDISPETAKSVIDRVLKLKAFT